MDYVADMAHSLRPEDPSFVDRARVLNVRSVEVAAPPHAVWPALVDAEAWAHWFTGVTHSEYTSAPPHGLGAVRSLHVKGLEVTERVIACDPDERFAFTVLEANKAGFAAMAEVVTLEATPVGTRVTYRQAVEPAWWLRPLSGVLRRKLGAELEAGLAGLDGWVAAHPV